MRPGAVDITIRKSAAAIRMLKTDLTKREITDPNTKMISRIRTWRWNQTKHKENIQEQTKTKTEIIEMQSKKGSTPLTKGWQKRATKWKNRMKDIAEAFPIITSKSTRKVRAFISHIGGEQRTTGTDTYAEVSMILDTIVDPSWPVIDAKGVNLRGVGTAKAGSLILVPVNFRLGSKTTHMEMRVAQKKMMPRGLEVLIGTQSQYKLGMTIDARANRLIIKKKSVMIDTEPIAILRARREAPALKILELAGGMSPAILMLKDMGWRINKWHASEINNAANKAANGIANMAGIKIKHLPDLEQLSKEDLLTHKV